LVGLLLACSLSLPASSQDLAEYQHCLEHHDVWVRSAQWSEVISTYFEPEDHLTAFKIIGCESWGIPTAKNPNSTATGLWQFISSTWSWVESKLNIEGSPMDPWLSTRFASFLKYKTEQGWGHWSESAHCWEVPIEKNKFSEID
jgi:hypothetical protein